jgi:hypothetical protein
MMQHLSQNLERGEEVTSFWVRGNGLCFYTQIVRGLFGAAQIAFLEGED